MKLLSTYRVQLNKGFNFDNVIEHLDYFTELGISHLYLSPVFQARPGSTHGYDVTDHTKINPELGGEDKYRELIRKAKEKGLGIIQDIVPNHTAVHSDNWRLMDVLKNGKTSKYYQFFDFYKEENKIRLPILEDSLDNVVSRGLIEIIKDKDGNYFLKYHDWRLPLSRMGQDLNETLRDQFYELTYWKEPPSYRRFFDVNELIAINQEVDFVFEETHKKILEFDVDGFRIDHVDGLYEPEKYVKKLKEKSKNKIILVEKILSFDEKLFNGPDGTTGYDFLNFSNLLYTFNEEDMTRVYYDFIGTDFTYDIDKAIKEAKKFVIEELFNYEVSRLSKLLGVSTETLKNYLSCLTRYRTYNNEVIKECDKGEEISKAAKERPEIYTKLQQFMPAVFAKAYEDTFLYRYNRLVSLNEVGSNLAYYHFDCSKFHEFNSSRISSLSLNATSTHDTKFSEDVRMKISAISEKPKEWEKRVKEWHEILNPKVDRNTEYRFYQVLVGSYYEGFTVDYKERLKSHMIKSVREAKEHTSWLKINQEYENKLIELVNETFDNKEFQRSFLEYETTIRKLGMIKSLSLLTLKVLSPGVPDFYQGTETWRYLLTDPDNRRSVDFDKLNTLLKNSKKYDSLMSRNMDDGRIKVYTTYKLLHLRQLYDEVIINGSYEPLKLPLGLCGFTRGKRILVIVKTLASLGEQTIRIDGEYLDVLTNEEIRNEVNVTDLPRVLIKEK
ncbi:malto-oligosyltrehalose synthase [Stygiolobus caldivivus]|uniref:Malto-oligosyltrehalose synthase n=1 Tax=Stygiolobus caldivivus TaxID=2824673 RepID=A0A8D5U7Z2_9CREN|nr:malto-oligosyltrehalose synthase [Stygiolobus caldivivus]BCU71276.1 malto-oligosyltrehalose synthase [Stygiolobus caldivivus]